MIAHRKMYYLILFGLSGIAVSMFLGHYQAHPISTTVYRYPGDEFTKGELLRQQEPKEKNAGLIKRVQELEGRLAAAEKQLAVIKSDPNPEKGYLRVGNMLICWGRKILPLGPGPQNRHIRQFNFQFAQEFLTKPSVSTGFNLKTPANVFGVYHSDLDTKAFIGSIYDNKTGPDNNVIGTFNVEMSYVAIGIPKAR
jgi:hypothetical protein